MAAKGNKTVPTGASVAAFVAGIEDAARRAGVKQVMGVLERATGSKPKMWGSSIIGVGEYTYKYPSGREGQWCITGLSPRKANLTIYILPGLHLHAANLKKLGKVTTGKSCIYVRRVEDIDLPTLEAMARQAVTDMAAERDKAIAAAAKPESTRSRAGTGRARRVSRSGSPAASGARRRRPRP
jgi:hypothetical protein